MKTKIHKLDSAGQLTTYEIMLNKYIIKISGDGVSYTP